MAVVLTVNYTNWQYPSIKLSYWMDAAPPATKVWFRGSTVANLKLKGIDGRTPQGVASVA